MRLSSIAEAGHWEVPDINYPGDLSKGKKKRKSSRPMSFLTHPEDRDEFFGGITMGIKEEEDITKDYVEIPDSPQQKLKRDSVNNKAQLDRQKKLQSQLNPRFEKLKKDTTNISKNLTNKTKQAETDIKSYNDINKTVNDMTKTFADITKIMR